MFLFAKTLDTDITWSFCDYSDAHTILTREVTKYVQDNDPLRVPVRS